MSPEADKCIAKYLAGEQVEEELLQFIRSDKQVLDHLCEHLAMSRLLEHRLKDDKDPFLTATILKRLQTSFHEEPFTENVIKEIQKEQSSKLTYVNAIAAILFIGVGLYLLSPLMSRDEPVVRITSKESIVWSEKENLQQLVLKKPYHLKSGFLKLKFEHGTEVLIEGPSEFSIQNDMKIHMNQGKALANVPLAGHGFTIESPEAEIIDLGTTFGVEVDKVGKTELHVIEGLVKAKAHWEHDFHELKKDQAIRWNRLKQKQDYLDAREELFLQALPSREKEKQSHYLHYSFNEPEGEMNCDVQGYGFDLDQAKGEIYYHSRKLNTDQMTLGPKRIPGVFGNGLQFNQKSGWVKTHFSGIPGDDARTVSFWVKIDPSEKLAFAIFGWGDLQVKGGIFQLSLNPQKERGPLGRLRLGIQGGEIMGEQNLQDGKWHHVAVVMYNGQRKDRATLNKHVLIYVDGILEMTSRKSFAYVNTNIKSKNAEPLTIGKTASSKQLYPFNGSIDELYIVNRALTQKEIQSLMKNDASFLEPPQS